MGYVRMFHISVLWTATHLVSAAGTTQPDWLLAANPEPAEVVQGTLQGTPVLILRNGLVSRTFTLPSGNQPPQPPWPLPPNVTSCPAYCGDSCCSSTACPPNVGCCANPGNATHSGPNHGEVYPYYGKPCSQQSDCGQCTLDGTCTCTQTSNNSKCCLANADVPPPAPSGPLGFSTIQLSRQGYAGLEHDTSAQLLRAPSPEAVVSLDGTTYNVGGLVGQKEFAFLNLTTLKHLGADPQAFGYKSHRTGGSPRKRYEWTPGARHSDSTASWPAKGTTLEIDFAAPPSAPPAHQAVTITVVYELYAAVPLYAKYVVISVNATAPGAGKVVVSSLTPDMLYLTNEAVGYWAMGEAGGLTSATTSGRVHMESEMSRGYGGGTTVIGADSRCTTCTQGSSQVALSSVYPLGPGAEIGLGGFHGSNFTSFVTYTLLHDSDDTERQGLAVRRMYRTVAPQVTENPVFMHLTDTSPEGIKKAADQCAEAGFEMIILSFGSGLNMESKDEVYIKAVADSVAYCHSKNISIGGYNLMSSSRTVAPGGNCVDPDGKPNGASCLASSWSDDYFDTIKNFIEKTAFDMIETDGPYEGHRNMDFYAWCRARGMYIHAPDPFYVRGINKDGMGYVETNWNLELWEQINLARQNIYDGTMWKIPSQGWMFVPISQYHGGWPECCIEPVGFLAGQWEFYLQMYFGTGVSPCYRGSRIYNDDIPETKSLIQKYTAWNNQYRTILHADIIHLNRADGDSVDAILHVEPDSRKCRERAMLVVFNQNPTNHENTTMRVPLYYSGLDLTTMVSKEGASPVAMTLSRDWSVQINLVMAPSSFTWVVFE
eukprot:gene7468-1334_t